MPYCIRLGTAIASLILVTACGGGGGGGGGGNTGGGGGVDPEGPPFADNGGADSVSITAVSLNSIDRLTSLETGTFDQGADTFGFAGLSGTIDANGEVVTLDGGGQIRILPGSTAHAARFISEPNGIGRTIGVVGFETDVADLPSGSVSYAGTSELTIRDGGFIFQLEGDATIVADFAGGMVDTTVNNLNGIRTVGGATDTTDVSDVATITFTGSSITGAQFIDGTPTITSTTLTPLSGNEDSSLDGTFYGPGADEAGATFVIDDLADGDNSGLGVFGTVLAD